MAIVVRLVEDGESQDIRIGERPTIFGRSSKCDIKLMDPTSSSKHCQIYQTNSKCVIKDLNSRNGTLINGSPIEESYLYIGDIVQIGNAQLILNTKRLTPEEKSVNSKLDSIENNKALDLDSGEEVTVLRKHTQMITSLHDMKSKGIAIEERKEIKRQIIKPLKLENSNEGIMTKIMRRLRELISS